VYPPRPASRVACISVIFGGMKCNREFEQLKCTPGTDVSNFDSEFTKEAPVLTPCQGVLSAVDQDQLKGFTKECRCSDPVSIHDQFSLYISI
jgi:hypothetical protein